MPRIVAFCLYLGVALSIVASTHYYLWARLIRDVALPAPAFYLLTTLIVALGASIPVTMLVSRAYPGVLAKWMVWATFCWMGFFFLLLSMLLGCDMLRFAFFLFRRFVWGGAAFAPERRQFLVRLYGGAIAWLGLGAGALALRNGLGGAQVTRVRVALARWPQDLSAFTIAQISDLHVAPLLGRDYVEQVVSRISQLKPSMIVLTGDLVDGSVEALRQGVAPLAQLTAPHGVFMVTGNHEYYSGADAWIAEFTRLGIKVLRNERVRVGTSSANFDLAGIDDFTAARFGHGHGADLNKALAGRDPTRELVLLAHQPKAVFEAAQHGVGLMLCGHTHGGQIWPFGYLVKLVQPYLRGLARHASTWIYVNRGTGYWGPPMRLGSMPEITLLDLHRG